MKTIAPPLHPFHLREAALCAPAMPLLILVGIATGHAVDGATAAGAAFAVGFGAARELRGRRWGAMIAAMVGMACTTFIGCLAGQSQVLFVGLSAMAASLCAGAALKDEDAWWVILQLVITFFVAGSYPGSVGAAGHRAVMVLFGGMTQIAVVLLLARLFPAAAAPTITPVGRTADDALLKAHMLRAAICVAVSLILVSHLGLSNGYWGAMTALIVLKPRLHETGMRGLARLTGTLSGCALATAYAHLCRDSAIGLIFGLGMAATCAFALQKAHYASLTSAITATVVLLLTLGHSSALANAEHRLLATFLGGVIALGVAWVIPHARPHRLVGTDRVGVSS